jgi:hypothetical protein
MVLNLSETEKLVQEATNNEAWGASSTLMQQIAQGCVFPPRWRAALTDLAGLLTSARTSS